MKITNYINRIKEWLASNKQNLIRLTILFAVVGIIVFLLTYFNLEPIFFVIILSVLFLITWFFAGVVVFKSLFLIGAELSLIIFIADSYCKISQRTQLSDNALKNIFIFGIMYIAIIFIKSIFNEVKILEKKYNDRPWIVTLLFLLCMALFLMQLCLVIYPIMINLCVYK